MQQRALHAGTLFHAHNAVRGNAIHILQARAALIQVLNNEANKTYRHISWLTPE